MTDYWKDKRVFVTGSTGIVGSWLTRSLVDGGAYVVGLIRDWDPATELIRSGTVNRINVVTGRLEDYLVLERALNKHELDTVFHLGAQSLVGCANRSPLQTFETNIRGSYNLLEACRVHSSLVKRIVVASSDKAYGESENLPYQEEHPLQGSHPYDVSKSCSDLITQAYHHTYGIPVTIARCGNIYGGGDTNWSRIVPGTIRSLLLGEQPVIRSNGKYVRDYVYVKDIIDAFLRLAEAIDSKKGICGEAFNFSVESRVTVLELVEKIAMLMGRKDLTSIILDQAKDEIPNQYLCSEKAMKRLKWRPLYTLEEGLKETIEWYVEFLGAGQHRRNVYHLE